MKKLDEFKNKLVTHLGILENEKEENFINWTYFCQKYVDQVKFEIQITAVCWVLVLLGLGFYVFNYFSISDTHEPFMLYLGVGIGLSLLIMIGLSLINKIKNHRNIDFLEDLAIEMFKVNQVEAQRLDIHHQTKMKLRDTIYKGENY